MLLSILKRIATKRVSRFVFILLGVFFSLPFRTLQQEGEYGADGLDGEGNGEEERMIPGELPEEEGACYARNVTEYEVVAVEWVEVYVPYIIFIWVMLASLAKVGFHHTGFSAYFPESCLLIAIGFIIGLIISFLPERFHGEISGGLNGELFFIFLLPPIMLEAGYFMPAKAFFNNIGTILLYAVVGTLFNTFTIGFSLYGISVWLLNSQISLLECLTFSSLISAVDPVAVLAVFEEIHVNEVLHILVFGESLLNDAVTIVLYRMFETFNEIGEENLEAKHVILGLLSFFVVSIGGTVIGLIFGFLTSLLTRFTHHVIIVEPVIVLAMSYASYLTAECFKLSPILSIVFCAMFMKPYVEKNISAQSRTTLRHVIKMLSSVSETLIFIFLGDTTLAELKNHEWNTAFVMFTLLFCFVYRFLGVMWQTALMNRFRLAEISKKDQFVMGYGGIRGAIAFSLVALLCQELVASKNIMFTTTVVVVMFTMFVQGITIKPLVNLLEIKKQEHSKPTMNEKIYEQVNAHLMSGVEDILGHFGHYQFKKKWDHFNKTYIKRVLLRDYYKIEEESKFLRVAAQLNEEEAIEYIQKHGALPNTASSNDLAGQGNNGFSDETVVELQGVNGTEDFLNTVSNVNANPVNQLNLLDQNFLKPHKSHNRYSRHFLDDDDADYSAPSRMERNISVRMKRQSRLTSRHGGRRGIISMASRGGTLDRLNAQAGITATGADDKKAKATPPVPPSKRNKPKGDGVEAIRGRYQQKPGAGGPDRTPLI
ncbi:sodium/hydrogen exchanger 3-like [Amphiura filiformis]|uniref:sodium/hydrogen exchanger 3-like n=1 Tax=Amphiura filiformis TaxID=82378 RepID=UPI003B218445